MLGECNLIEFQKFIDRFYHCGGVLAQHVAKALEYLLKSLMYCSLHLHLYYKLKLALLTAFIYDITFFLYLVHSNMDYLSLSQFCNHKLDNIFANQWTPWNLGAVFQLNYYFWSTFTLPINVVLPFHLTLMEAYTSTW